MTRICYTVYEMKIVKNAEFNENLIDFVFTSTYGYLNDLMQSKERKRHVYKNYSCT